MPPKKPACAPPNAAKQKKFKPPLLTPPQPPPPPPLAAVASHEEEENNDDDDEDMGQSQSQVEDEIGSLGKILDSMMKASKDRHARRRAEIEEGYEADIKSAEKKARKWMEVTAAREKRRQLMVLIRLKTLLDKKRAIEEEVVATLREINDACEELGELLRMGAANHQVGLDGVA